LGDAILAIFDRPEHHAEDALNAAVSMLQNLKEFNRDRVQYNLEQAVNIGIGIHTGTAVIGTVGSDKRMDSTVIGDVVNTAARLEELTKLYGCQILASDTTLAHVSSSLTNTNLEVQNHDSVWGNRPNPSYLSRWVDQVTPRGKRVVLELYEILGNSTQVLDVTKGQVLPLYNAGLQAWRQEDFTRALDYFQQVVQQNPDDTIAMIYIERCQEHLSLRQQQAGTTLDGFISY
jgi:two-component system sensor histidine kinase ChiS